MDCKQTGRFAQSAPELPGWESQPATVSWVTASQSVNMGAISLIPLLMSVALLSRTALDMTREVNKQRQEERPSSYRSHNVEPAWGSKILGDRQQTESDFSDHQVTN